jgi:glutathione S-transferase
VKLYNVDGSPNCFRVRLVINELGLPVELVNVDLRNRSAEFLAASPGGKVPAFVDDDGFTLFESRAINAFLCSKDPQKRLYPDDAKTRALIDQWSYWQSIHLGPAMQAVSFERVGKKAFGMGEGSEEVAKQKLKETEGFLPVIEKGLEGKQWLVDQLSLADFATATTFVLRKPSNISLEAFPNTLAWIERVEALESWKAALPKYVRDILAK